MTCEYLREFSKKFETVLMGYSGAGGKLIHKKTLAKLVAKSDAGVVDTGGAP